MQLEKLFRANNFRTRKLSTTIRVSNLPPKCCTYLFTFDTILWPETRRNAESSTVANYSTLSLRRFYLNSTSEMQLVLICFDYKFLTSTP